MNDCLKVSRDSLVIRTPDNSDLRDLNLLVNSTGGTGYYKAIFGPFHLQTILDNSYISLLAEYTENDFQKTIAKYHSGEDSKDNNDIEIPKSRAFISLNDHIPLINHPLAFDEAIRIFSGQIPVTIHNTLFVNFWMFDEAFRMTPYEMIVQIFNICTDIDFFIWILPQSFITNSVIDSLFSSLKISKQEESKTDEVLNLLKGFKILFLNRADYLPKLAVRKARIEDNDDLIPIIQNSHPEVLYNQDRYFLANLIKNQDDQNQYYVGLDINSQISGMVAISLDVNMAMIMKIFDIDAYPDLVIQSDQLPKTPPLMIAIMGDIRLFDLETLDALLIDQSCLFIDFEKLKAELVDIDPEHISDYSNRLLKDHPDSDSIQAIVFCGFPRNEEETIRLGNEIIYNFDVIIELLNISEEDENDDEEGDFLAQHLDSLEVLRERFFSLDDHSDKKKATWRKISYEKESFHQAKENVQQFYSGVFLGLLHERDTMIERNMTLIREQPPKANAFAITLLALQDSYVSRSLDLVKICFEEQIDLAYCLYMVPNNSQNQDRKLVVDATNGFNYVKTRLGISFDQSLYIIHRNFFVAQENLNISRIISFPVHQNQESKISPFDNQSQLKDVGEYIQNLQSVNKTSVYDLLLELLKEYDAETYENPNYLGFKITVANNIVGLVILSRRMLSQSDIGWLRLHYRLDDYINYNRYRLRNQYMMLLWSIDPIYAAFTKAILRSIMRKCHKSVIYFHFCKELDGISNPPKEILEQLHFVPPKRFPQGEIIAFGTRPCSISISLNDEGKDMITDNSPSGELPLPTEAAPLYIAMKNQLVSIKTIVAKRVVILGGSSQSYSFLETLCSVPNIYYPNIYFILETIPNCLKSQATMENHNLIFNSGLNPEESKDNDDLCGCLTPQDLDMPTLNELSAMCFSARVNIIQGKLTDIDRENKAIILSDELVVEYDFLLISTWTQDNSSRSINSLKGIHPNKCADAGIFMIGNPSADNLAITWLKRRSTIKNDNIAISGIFIKVMTAAQGLIARGFDPSKLVCIIEEKQDTIEECGGNQQIMNLLIQSPLVAGIKQVFWNSNISEVSLSRNGFLQTVEIDQKIDDSLAIIKADGEKKDSESSNIRVNCSALLLCSGEDYQSCERDIFAAINDSGLVFDGGLIVNMEYQTVDPSIYAISNYTKFSRLFREEIPHRRYNPKETGIYVALEIITKHLYPHLLQFSIFSNNNSSIQLSSDTNFKQTKELFKQINDCKHIKRPRFSLPRSIFTRLPGDFNYFISQLPKRLPSDNLRNFTTDNHTIENPAIKTFGPAPPRRISNLKIDNLGYVQEFCFIGMSDIDYLNLTSIPGNHETYLNNAVSTYQKQLIYDWIEFFQKEWAIILYFSQFKILYHSLRSVLNHDKNMVVLLSRIFERSLYNQDDVEIDSYRRTLTGNFGEFLDELTVQAIQHETIEFLRDNKDFLNKFYLKSNTPGLN